MGILDKEFTLKGYYENDPILTSIFVAINVSDGKFVPPNKRYTFGEDGEILTVTSATDTLTYGYEGDLPTSCTSLEIITGVETTGTYTYDDESVLTNMEFTSKGMKFISKGFSINW